MVIDMGGATTDVYSCAVGAPESSQTIPKGLPEPFAKRTVEADIGMRYTLKFLAEQLDLPALATEADIALADLNAWLQKAQANPDCIPATAKEQVTDMIMARAGCRLALMRHAGRLEESFTAAGRIYLQSGKDLGNIKTIIGSGGPIINSLSPKKILMATCRAPGDRALLPYAPAFYIDHQYIFWAMGLLKEVAPKIALRIMRDNLQLLTS